MLALVAILLALGAPPAPASSRVAIPAGAFRPLFGSEGLDLPVGGFWLDQVAVTAGEFARFTRDNPAWRKGRAGRDVADPGYLAVRVPPRSPVVSVSWFAAQAFCESRGGRLPTTLEWEYVAAASANRPDASRDPAFERKILSWYETREGIPGPAGSGEPNYYGVRGLHGLIWEWTSDFNAFFVAADNRQDGEQSKNFFCGAGATGAENREGYAAFLRYALRGSLQASFTLSTLGFRCAYDHD
jgi:formylglycine-generating enzyme required for sulfatase activity